MSTSRALTVVLLVCITTHPQAYGKALQCRYDYFAFDTAHQDCLTRESKVRSIRKIFAKSRYPSCTKCRSPFPDAKKYSDLFGKPFLPLSIKQHDFGGTTVSVIFKGDSRIFRVWLYPIEMDKYQIRAMSPESLTDQETSEMLKYAKDKKLSKYWL